MAEHINPEMNKEAFNCAICGAFADQTQHLVLILDPLSSVNIKGTQ